jgi:hypothetical protein
MGFLAFFVGIVATERLAYAENVAFNVTVKKAWNEYQMTSESYPAKSDGHTAGKCGHDADQYGTVNIPFAQTVILGYSVSGLCRSNYARYRPEAEDWIGLDGAKVLSNYQGKLDVHAHSRNDREEIFGFGIKCRSCTVTVTVSYSGGVPTPKEITETLSYSISSDQVIPIEIDQITIPISGNVVPQGATCEAESGHNDVQVLCEQRGEGFVLYANIDNEAPTVSNPSPAIKTILEERAPVTLSWTGTDPENDPLSYNVYFGRERICRDITTTTCVVPVDKLNFGTEYLWHVEVKDKYKTTTGDIWDFSIRDNLPPTKPTSISPTNGLEEVAITEALTFEWNASTDPDNDEITYQLCRQKEGGDIVCNPKQSDTSKTLPADTLEYGTGYEWFVVAKDSYGNSTFGDTWTLATIPAPVNLLMTADSGRSNTRLEWSITNDADVAHYRVLRVKEGEAFTPDKAISIVDTPADFFYDEAALEANTNYCYRIDALDADKKPLHQSNSSCITAGVTKLAMKNTGGLKGTKVDIPIVLPNAGNLQIGSSDIWLGYDPRVIKVTDLKKEGSLLDVAGMDYTVGYSIDEQADDFWIVKIAVSDNSFTSPPLEGEGPLVYVTFDVIGDAFSSSPLKLIPFTTGLGGSTIQDHNFEDIPLIFEDNSFTVQTKKRVRDGKQGPQFYVGAEYSPGDLNGNGTIQTVDARMAQFIGVGRLVPNSKQLTAGDVNGDDTVDSVDAYKIGYYALNAEWPGTANQTRRAIRDGKSTPILLSLEEVSAESGSVVTTTLSIDNLAKLSAMNLTIVYDTQVIEKVTNVSKVGLTTETDLVFHDEGNGILRIGVSTQNPISGNGDLATLTLQLATGGSVNNTPLSIAQAHLYNRAGHDFAITLQREIKASHGKVTLIDVEEVPVIKDDGVVTSIEELLSAPASSCQLYAVNDKGLNDSQFFTVNLVDLTISELGHMHKGHDIESLAIHPETNMIYAASGDNVTNEKPGHFYRVDGETGKLFPVGSSGFKEIEDLAFSPDGTLYAWAKGDGLITINLTTGVGTLMLDSDIQLEGLTLKKNEGNVFLGAVGTDLWQYDGELKVVCDNLLGETEALEITPEGLLLIGTHNVPFGIHAFDVENCQIIKPVETLSNKYNDVEGIALPVEACSK